MTKAQSPFKELPEAALKGLLDHQRWLSSNGKFGKRLDDETLDDDAPSDWRLLRFDGINLDGIDLSGASLYSAVFVGGSLRGARFVGTYLNAANFTDCDIEGANFAGADISDAVFLTNHRQAINLKDNPFRHLAAFNKKDLKKLDARIDREMKDFAQRLFSGGERPDHQRRVKRPGDAKPKSVQDQTANPKPGS